jgi:thiol-disulfide isomerase/thioredoxin
MRYGKLLWVNTWEALFKIIFSRRKLDKFTGEQMADLGQITLTVVLGFLTYVYDRGNRYNYLANRWNALMSINVDEDDFFDPQMTAKYKQFKSKAKYEQHARMYWGFVEDVIRNDYFFERLFWILGVRSFSEAYADTIRDCINHHYIWLDENKDKLFVYHKFRIVLEKRFEVELREVGVKLTTDKFARRKTWRKRALHLLWFIVFIAGIRTWQQRDVVSVIPASLVGVKLDGSAYTLPAKPVHPVLVHFWASWCAICRAEQESISYIAQENPNIITVAIQSGSDAEVARYLIAQGLRFPVLNDSDGRISTAWGVHAVPTSFIISPDGRIRFVEVGYTTGLGLKLRLWLAEMLS